MLSPSKRLGADLLLLSVAIVWGATFVVVKESVATTPVFSYLFLRFGLAFGVLLPFIRRHEKLIDPAYLRAGALLGLFYFSAFGAQTLGLVSVGASMSAFLTGLYVVIVPLLLWLIFRHPPRRNALIASIVAVGGLWLLSSPDDAHSSWGFGELATLFCALLFALHIILTDRYSRRFDPLPLVTIQLGVVTLLSWLSSLLFEPVTWPQHFEGSLLLSLLLTGVLATAYALLVQTWMQRYTTPTRTAIIFAMEPVSAAFFGYLFAGEYLSPLQTIGGSLIVIAMLLAEWGSNESSGKSKKRTMDRSRD